MRIVIACDGSEIAESAVAAVAALGPDACGDVHLLSVVDPNDLHGLSRAGGASPFFVAITTGQGEVVRAQGGGAAVPASIGLMGHEVRKGDAEPTMAEDRGQAMERAKAEHSDYLRAVAGHYLTGHEVTYEVAFAHDPADAIAEQARDLKADMIALGSHGRSGVNRAIMGSVAEKLMRHASTPVLVIGPTARESMPPHAPEIVASGNAGQ